MSNKCFSFFNKNKKCENNDYENKYSSKDLPIVTGNIVSKKQDVKRIPVNVSLGTSHLLELLNNGWKTYGEIIKINDMDYMWYEKNTEHLKETIPSCPDKDVYAEYVWLQVSLNDLETHQNNHWLARSLCCITNKIWMCKRKT